MNDVRQRLTRKDPPTITPERANEIIAKARAGYTGCGYDWVEHLRDHMTESEKREVMERWKSLRGSSCWWDAFNSFRAGIVS